MTGNCVVWRLALLCFFSGVGCVLISIAMKVGGDPAYWFWFGYGVPLYCFAFSDLLDSFHKWRKNTPPFKGWRYWIKKALNKETTKDAL